MFSNLDHEAMLKVYVKCILYIAAVVIAAFFVGWLAAIAVGINGIFALVALKPLLNLIQAIKLERSGVYTMGEIVGQNYTEDRMYIVGYQANDGNYYTEACDFIALRNVDIGSEYTVIYDENNPKKVSIKKYTLMAKIIQYSIFLFLQVLALVITTVVIYYL